MSGVLQAVFQNVRSFGPPSFIANLYQSTTAKSFGNGNSATSTSFVVGGSANSTVNGPETIYVASQDTSGVIQWQKQGSINYSYLRYLTTSANGNIYTLSDVPPSTTSFTELGFSSFNSSGTLLANKNITADDTQTATGIGVDSSGNSYITCVAQVNGIQQIGIVKLDSSGNAVWNRGYSTDPTANAPQSSFTNSSGTTFIVGTYSASPSRAFVSVINSSGTHVSTKAASDYFGSTDFYGKGVIEDSSGNVYLVTIRTRSDNSQREIILSKWDSAGTVQWNTTVSGVGGNVNDRICITLDSSGNIYYGTSGGELIKYNSSGTLQWQRKFANSYDIQLKSISVTGNTVFVSGYARYRPAATDYYYSFEAAVPTDGSKTGTYSLNSQTYTYSVTAYTTRTLTVGFSSLFPFQNYPGFSVTSPSNTYSTSSLTAVKVTL